MPAGCAVLLDLYVIAGEAPDSDPERSAEKIRALLGRLPEPLERVAVAVRRPKGDERSAWFTFRPAGGARAGRASTRPIGGRWRTARCAGCTRWSPSGSGCGGCAGFELTRLPSPIDVHLFRAVGRNVPEDRRLVVLSDVRDLTVVRDAGGRIRSLPQLEHVLDSCLDALRAARAADRGDAALDWNRVLLYLWPVVDLPVAELDLVVRMLAPRAEGLGLEQVGVAYRTPGGRVRADRAAAAAQSDRRAPDCRCRSPSRRRARCGSWTATPRR